MPFRRMLAGLSVFAISVSLSCGAVAAVTPQTAQTEPPVVGIETPEVTVNPSEYEDRTLQELKDMTEKRLVADMEAHPNEKLGLYVLIDLKDRLASSVRVDYTGDFRDIDPNRKLLIKTTLQHLQISNAEAMSNLYHTEGRFVENGVEYWIPVQDSLVTYMKQELRADADITVLLVWVGAVFKSGNIDRVYLITGYHLTNPDAAS